MSENKVKYVNSSKKVTYRITGTDFIAESFFFKGAHNVHVEVRIMRQGHPEKSLTVFASAFPVENKTEMILANTQIMKTLHDPATIGIWLDYFDP